MKHMTIKDLQAFITYALREEEVTPETLVALASTEGGNQIHNLGGWATETPSNIFEDKDALDGFRLKPISGAKPVFILYPHFDEIEGL